MKKILLTAMLIFVAIISNAQIYKFKTTSFAYQTINWNGTWSEWSDWSSSDLLVVFNFNKEVVTIYSPYKQVYNLIEYSSEYIDKYGGSQYVLSFIDQDFDRGIMRLRTEANGNAQIYIDFTNIRWVYNVTKYCE